MFYYQKVFTKQNIFDDKIYTYIYTFKVVHLCKTKSLFELITKNFKK